MEISFAKKIVSVIAMVMLCVSLFVQVYANIFHYAARMDADVAGEAMLAKEIADNNLRIPDTWYISTETRYIYPANLAAVIYYFSGNLCMSMGIACSVCAILLIMCMYVLYRKIGMGSAAAFCASFIPFVLSLNVHDGLEMFSLYAGYYFPVLVVFFITGMAVCDLVKGKRNIFSVVVSLVLSLVLGAQGMRGTLMVYIPYTAAAACMWFFKLFRKKSDTKKYLKALGFSFVLTAISFFSCKVLSSGVSDTSRNIRKGFAKLIFEVIPSSAKLLEWDGNFLYLAAVIALFAAAVIYSICCIFKNNLREEAAVIFIGHWFSLLIMIAAMAFTTFEAVPRYAVFMFFLVGMSIGLVIDETKENMIFFAPMLLIVLCTIFSSYYNYDNLIVKDKSGDSALQKVSVWMEENCVKRGYATFDYAEVISVVSNCRSTVYPVNNMSQLLALKWLSNAKWYPPYSDGNEIVAIITTDATDEDFKTCLLGNPEVKILKSERIGKFNCYILNRNPVRLE